MTGVPWSRLTAVAVLLGLALVAGTGLASAHSYPVSSNPADGATLASGPPRVSITFNEALQTSFVLRPTTSPGTRCAETRSPRRCEQHRPAPSGHRP